MNHDKYSTNQINDIYNQYINEETQSQIMKEEKKRKNKKKTKTKKKIISC